MFLHPMKSSLLVHRSRNHLDWLRLVFASLVLLSHAPELIDGNRSRELFWRLTNVESFGGFAVSGFFALSGFLIMASWERAPQLFTYFKNRILRICPGFVVAFLISVLIVGPLAAGGASYFEAFDASQFFFSMMTLREPWFANSFPGSHHHGVNGALWTISYEFACYVAIPFIALLARAQWKSVWLAITWLLLVSACFIPELESMPRISRFFVAPLVKMSAIFFAGASLRMLGFRGFKRPTAIIAVGSLFVATWFMARFEVVGFALFGSMFFLSIGLLKSGTDFHLPDISYGTYLYGWPVLQLLIWFLPGQSPWLIFAVALVLSLLCGALSWTFVEAPFMRYKNNISRSPSEALSAT